MRPFFSFKPSLRTGIILTYLLSSSFFLSACQDQEQPQTSTTPAPAEVDVARPLTHKITEWDEFTGRFEATQRVDIRARVTGYLTEKKFTDGQMVHKGDVLFIIDPRPFEYDVERANAQYIQALKDYQRAESLRKTQAISQEDFDQRAQELKVAEAALNDAKLNLEFTKITAPINGKISDSFVDVGNIVRENTTILTRLVSLNPIHFEFETSQDMLLKYTRLEHAGKRGNTSSTANPIFIKLQDENQYLHQGRMDFVDNIVDPDTGTIQSRALIENNDGLLYPGLFGRARLIGRSNFDAILLPERAINTDQDRKFVYILNDQDQASRRYITLGKILDNDLVIIEDGLTGDERVVINGIQRIRAADQIVTPVLQPLTWEKSTQIPNLETVPTLAAIRHAENISASPNSQTSSLRNAD